MITDEFREQVTELRAQGLSWPKISRAVGRPQRTCQRAVEKPKVTCKHRGCDRIAALNGSFCSEHAGIRQRKMKPGEGPRQKAVMRLMHKHGLLSSEQLGQLTGVTPDVLARVMRRLVELGLLEHPVRGYYRLPRANAER